MPATAPIGCIPFVIAFIAGLMLAETEYRRAIEAIIEPFKGLLLGLLRADWSREVTQAAACRVARSGSAASG